MKKRSILRLILLSLILLTGFNASFAQEEKEVQKHSVHWTYSGEEGPNHWGDLKPEYAPCKNGYTQSPIDIGTVYNTKLTPLKLTYLQTSINIINNGHTIQQNCSPGSSAIIYGQKYDLIQFHFHTPSEHTVNGKHYPLEMHLVHKNKNGAIAVIGVFFKYGKPNKALQEIISNIPKEVDKPVENKMSKINIEELIPGKRKYYHYFGSLTTPPCSEEVNWNIYTTPVQASKEQIQKLHEIMGDNARPVQPLHNRFVLESE